MATLDETWRFGPAMRVGGERRKERRQVFDAVDDVEDEEAPLESDDEPFDVDVVVDDKDSPEVLDESEPVLSVDVDPEPLSVDELEVEEPDLPAPERESLR